MSTKKLLNIELQNFSKSDILDKIQKYIDHPIGFYHITSLNPETVIIASKHKLFNRVIQSSQIKINDGVGIVIASKILSIPTGARYSGVDLMTDLLTIANKRRLTVMLIGAGPEIADRVVDCQHDKYPNIKFISMQGIKNINDPQSDEENKILTIVRNQKPHLIFAAFGSPSQELWLYNHRHQFSGIICMGVGGAFDFLSNNIPRPPAIIRMFGLEWFFRLIISPKRLYKQSYWIRLMYHVIASRV